MFCFIYRRNIVVGNPIKCFFKRGVQRKSYEFGKPVQQFLHKDISVFFYHVSKLIDLFEEETLTTSEKKKEEGHEEDLDLPFFDFATIARATNDFSSDKRLGQGGFGPVYRVNN